MWLQVRTVFIGGTAQSVPDIIERGRGAPVVGRAPPAPAKPAVAPKAPKVATRSIGVGGGNVFDSAGSNFQVSRQGLSANGIDVDYVPERPFPKRP